MPPDPLALAILFLSTLSLRRATNLQHFMTSYLCNFYPRSPCGERRPISANIGIGVSFLSTLSLRRATRRWFPGRRCPANFYPRSPCGERLRRSASIWLDRWISIHALLAESDLMWPWSPLNNDLFLSTLSLRRATCGTSKNAANYQISIHALLAESDARP